MPEQLKTDIAGVTIQSPRKRANTQQSRRRKSPPQELRYCYGQQDFLPRKFDCPHIMTCVDLVAAHRACLVMDALSKSPLSATHNESVI